MKLELLAYLTALALLAAVLTTHQWAPAVGLAGLLLIPGNTRGKPHKETIRSNLSRYSRPSQPSPRLPPRRTPGSTR